MNLGMNVTSGSLRIPHQWVTASFMVHNLSTLMAGTKPIDLPVTIQSETTYIKCYGFSLPNGEILLALWNDGNAVDFDPGIPSTLIISGYTSWEASGDDVLNGFEQKLSATNENGNLIIRDFLLKDYPIIIRLSK